MHRLGARGGEYVGGLNDGSPGLNPLEIQGDLDERLRTVGALRRSSRSAPHVPGVFLPARLETVRLLTIASRGASGQILK